MPCLRATRMCRVPIMQGRTRRVGVAVVMAAVAALGSACSSTPNAVGPCHHVVAYPSDGGYIAAFDWDNRVHAYGEEVPFTACLSSASTAFTEGPPGVIIDPTEQPLEPNTLNVVTFTVTVTEGSAGQIWVRLEYSNGDLLSRPPGPVITPSGDGWRFTLPDRSGYPLSAFYEPDQHLAAAPTYEDSSILKWLLAQ